MPLWEAFTREAADDSVQRWRIVEQLALKALCDVKHYDRVKVNQLRGRQPDAITESEVWAALPEVLRRIGR